MALQSSNVQAVYLIIADPHPQEDIRAFSVVVLTSEPGSGAHYCSISKSPLKLQSITLAVVVVWISLWYRASLSPDGFMIPRVVIGLHIVEVVSV